MPVVPLGMKAYRRNGAFVPEVQCVNMLLEKDENGASPDGVIRVQRPGLDLEMATPFSVRGLYQQAIIAGTPWLLGVMGTGLYVISGGVATLRGAVAGSGRVVMTSNYDRLFVLSSPNLYYQIGTAAPVAIVVPDGKVPIDIETINNFLVVACTDGRFYWLDPGLAVIDVLDFATAESAADGLVAVKRLVDELWFFGATTIEVWQMSSNPDAPFLRAGGRTVDVGCLGRDTVKLFDNSLVWVGRAPEISGRDNPIVYRSGNVPIRISDHGLEERLRNRIGEPSAMVIEDQGHKLYVLKIPGHGYFAFDAASGEWAEFQWASGAPHVASGVYLGDETLARLYRLNPLSSSDDGAPMKRILSGTIPLGGRGPRVDSLSIGTGSEADFTLKVRWKDGRDDFPAVYEEIEVRAPFDVANLYRLGTPDQPFRTFEILIDSNVKARIAGAVANQAWK